MVPKEVCEAKAQPVWGRLVKLEDVVGAIMSVKLGGDEGGVGYDKFPHYIGTANEMQAHDSSVVSSERFCRIQEVLETRSCDPGFESV